MAGQMTIGGLSKQTECNIETIRYYEKIGMLPKPRRTGGGHRVYNETHTRCVQFIRRARALGFSLDDVRRLLALAEGKPKPCDKAKALAEGHLEDIQARIRDLKAMEKVLKQLVSQCSGKTAPACPILDSLQD